MKSRDFYIQIYSIVISFKWLGLIVWVNKNIMLNILKICNYKHFSRPNKSISVQKIKNKLLKAFLIFVDSQNILNNMTATLERYDHMLYIVR